MKSKKKKRYSLKFSPVFCPIWGEEQKKKVITPISPGFCPSLDEDRKKKKKERSSLNFCPVFAQNWVLAKNKRFRLQFVCSNLLPKLQNGGPCRNFAYYSMQIILFWRPKGGAMAQWPPPKYAPDRDSTFIVDCHKEHCYLQSKQLFNLQSKQFKYWYYIIRHIYQVINL